jgi:ketosteroid isomerase-like protein
MSTETTTTTTTPAAVVQAGFAAFGMGDLAGFGDMFHPDATWNHRNDDHLGGIHHGREGVLAFIAASGERTAGTLRAAPLAVMTGEEGRVAVLVRVSATRPDGRAFDDLQILLFVVDGDRVRSVDQFVGDPAAVTAFWA